MFLALFVKSNKFQSMSLYISSTIVWLSPSLNHIEQASVYVISLFHIEDAYVNIGSSLQRNIFNTLLFNFIFNKLLYISVLLSSKISPSSLYLCSYLSHIQQAYVYLCSALHCTYNLICAVYLCSFLKIISNKVVSLFISIISQTRLYLCSSLSHLQRSSISFLSILISLFSVIIYLCRCTSTVMYYIYVPLYSSPIILYLCSSL